MSEFCPSSTTNTHFSSLLLSDFIFFCSLILSHPLYFSYFIFFSPYLLKLLSFLSPLFITTSLLLLAVLSVSPGLVDDNHYVEVSNSKGGFFLSTYHKVVGTLRSRLDDNGEEFCLFEDLEAYVMVFDLSSLKMGEIPVDVSQAKWDGNGLQGHDIGLGVLEVLTSNVEENQVEVTQRKSKGNNPVDILQGTDLSEYLTDKAEEKQVEPDKVGENEEEPLMGNGSEAPSIKVTENPVKVSSDNGGEHTSKVSDNPEVLGSTLRSVGSMRKEKEWKRTLACKLYEERRNVDEDEGMDLLWEAYEADSGKVKGKNKDKKGTKKCEVEYYDDEEEEEEDMDGQLCCLRALRFSTGKMNLGMGRPNLVRISKAFKGIGWLHQISRRGKKG